MAKLSASDLKALLEAEKADALASTQASSLSADRSKALDYYLGDMSDDMPSLPDRSSAVSTDVADTVEGLMPSLMEIFTGGDEVVRFDPVGQEDEDAAAQETDYTNHVFMQKNPGFVILYTFIKDALLSKNGFVKVRWENKELETRERFVGLTEEEVALLRADKTVEIVEDVAREVEGAPEEAMQGAAPVGPVTLAAVDGMPVPPNGQPVPPSILHDVTAVQRKEYGCARVENIPPEEFGISRRAKSMADCDYCYHENPSMTQAALIAAGFDEAQIDGLPTGEASDDEEQQARDTVNESDDTTSANVNRSTRPIQVTDHYVRMNYDGSGARLYQVTTGGNQGDVLNRGGKPAIEEVDVIPIASMSPIIMPHRFFGRSVADVVMDIQRIKTALLRTMLDNAYGANNGRTEIAESHANANTIDDYINNRPGGIVRTKQPGGLTPIPHVEIGSAIFPLMDYMDATREWRTGVTRQGQGIDADALQNQTAEAVSKVFSAAQARMRLIARIFAETGIKDLFSLLHRTIRTNASAAATAKLRGKWVEVDPREWKQRDDMTINVGIGTGGKEQQFAFLMALLGVQKEALMVPGLGLVKPENIYHTMEKIVEVGGLKSVDPYFTDPTNAPPQEQPPSPEMMKVQAQAEADKAKLQLSAQESAARLQQSQQQAQADMQLEVAKAKMEGNLAREKAEMEAQLAISRMQAEFQLEREQMAMQAEMDRQRMAVGAVTALDKNRQMSSVRMGGRVG